MKTEVGATVEGQEASRRPYRSSVREAQACRTRPLTLERATRMFCVHGYAGTPVAAVAAAAGVSVASVELAFPTKPDLLKAAIDVAIAGDDETMPVLERPWAGADPAE